MTIYGQINEIIGKSLREDRVVELVVSRPVAREFLTDAIASSGIEFPSLRSEELS